MKKFAYAVPIVAFLALWVFIPTVLADSAPINSNVWNPTILQGPLVTCTGAGAGGTKTCTNLCDLISTAANVVYFGIGVVIWIIAPIMIAWSGIRLVFSRGNPEATSGARKMIWGVVIGLFIVLCAYLIVYTFISVLGITGIGGFGTSACQVK